MTLSPIGLRCGIALYIVDLSYLHRSITVNLMMFLLTIYQTYSKVIHQIVEPRRPLFSCCICSEFATTAYIIDANFAAPGLSIYPEALLLHS